MWVLWGTSMSTFCDETVASRCGYSLCFLLLCFTHAPHTHSHNYRFFLFDANQRSRRKMLLLLSTLFIMCYTRMKYWDQRMGKTIANRIRSLFVYRSTTPTFGMVAICENFTYFSHFAIVYHFQSKTEAETKDLEKCVWFFHFVENIKCLELAIKRRTHL